MTNPRKIALKALLKIEKEGSYSNLTIKSVFSQINISQTDKAFVTALVYGVLERKITLDYVLQNHIKTPLKKVSAYSLLALRIALYQIMYMDKVPQSAAVNESVKLIKSSKEARNSGFVNAVLRNILRSKCLLPTGTTSKALSVIYSCPEAIVNSFIKDYGTENAICLLKAALEPAPLTVKVNTTKINVQDFIKNIGVDCDCSLPLGAVVLKKGIAVAENPLYKQGCFFVQDTASQRVVELLSPKPTESMLDMCAAPGGKSFSSAIAMQNTGKIVACDLYEHKCALIKDAAQRLGLDIIETKVQDATVFDKELGLFDCVLCDVPCSGLGIIRRKPEIKYKEFSAFDDLPDIQYQILCNATNYLKSGGRILYSTCTLRKAENEAIVERFLAEYSNFCLKYSHTFMPHTDNTDGFFCALLQHK